MSDAATATEAPLPPEIHWCETYFIRGAVKRGQFSAEPAVQDPPTSGWTHVFVVPGKKQSTLFCPYTLWSANVPNRCLEIKGAKPAREPLDGRRELGDGTTCTTRDTMVAIINRRWELACRLNIPADFDVAALVLNRLGATVPTYARQSAVEADGSQKERGGKPIDEAKKRFVRPDSVRGGVLRFFIEGTRSIREAMAELGLSRSGVLSHLFTLNRDHGIGYQLAADCATVLVPEGWDPFEAPARAEPVASPDGSPPTVPRPERAARGSRGKATDPARLLSIPEGSKRAQVAQHFARGWSTVAGCEAATGIGARSVQSHLHDIHSYHGIGHEVDADRVRIAVPEGHALVGPKPERRRRET
jgi:hypothetical protein